MQNVKLHHPMRQVFLTTAGFVVMTALLEADGLVNWANRLDPGALRSLAMPVARAVQKTVQPLGLTAMREVALNETARLGWSDDAVRLARQKEPAETAAASCLAPGGSSSQPVLRASAMAPIVASVPRNTNLAPLAPVAKGKPRVVALTGDSMMAVGLSPTLMRLAAEDGNVRIVKAFRSGTGLARPDVFNWMDQYPAMMGTEKPDVVIVAIGANDGQSF